GNDRVLARVQDKGWTRELRHDVENVCLPIAAEFFHGSRRRCGPSDEIVESTKVLRWSVRQMQGRIELAERGRFVGPTNGNDLETRFRFLVLFRRHVPRHAPSCL